MSTTLPISRFTQNYNQHLNDAERTDAVIILEQRSGKPAWVLQSEHRVRANAEANQYLSAALAALVHDNALVERFAAAFTETLPWVAFLPQADRDQFVVEASDTLRACASIDRYTAFADLIEDWKNTAEVWSDPALAAALSGDVDRPVDQRV